MSESIPIDTFAPMSWSSCSWASGICGSVRRKAPPLALRFHSALVHCLPRLAVAGASVSRKDAGFNTRGEDVHEKHKLAHLLDHRHVGQRFRYLIVKLAQGVRHVRRFGPAVKFRLGQGCDVAPTYPAGRHKPVQLIVRNITYLHVNSSFISKHHTPCRLNVNHN
jgi:hypothetical protein